jgi:hypothetical protein
MTLAAPQGGISPSSEQRRLIHAVANASDAVLGRIVAVFDRLPERREADRLLDAARPRLRRLRPPRPIGLARLLFLPLDGAIVDPRNWKRQDGSLPRSALLPLAEAVRISIGAEATAIEAAFAGATFSDLGVVGAAGLRLWRAAAAAATSLPPPATWPETGLAAADLTHCISLAGGVWRHAGPLWGALAAAAEGPPDHLVAAAMAAAAGEQPMVIEAILATILMKATRPGSVATAAAGARLPPGLADRALDRWLGACHPDIPDNDPAGAARLAEEFATAIADLEDAPAARRPERRQRVGALRRQADEACRAAFMAAAAKTIIEPLMARGGGIEDAGIGRMENAARALKRLEQAGRGLGGGTAYDAAIRRLGDSLVAMRAAPGANIADLARMAEILAGPEAAMRLLEGG